MRQSSLFAASALLAVALVSAPTHAAEPRILTEVTEATVRSLPKDRGIVVIALAAEVGDETLSLEGELILEGGGKSLRVPAGGTGVAIEVDAGEYRVRPQGKWSAARARRGKKSEAWDLQVGPSRRVKVGGGEVIEAELTAQRRLPPGRARGACGRAVTRVAERRASVEGLIEAGSCAPAWDAAVEAYVNEYLVTLRACEAETDRQTALLELAFLAPGPLVNRCGERSLTKTLPPGVEKKLERLLPGKLECARRVSTLESAWKLLASVLPRCEDPSLWFYYATVKSYLDKVGYTCPTDPLAPEDWKARQTKVAEQLRGVTTTCPSRCATNISHLQRMWDAIATHLPACSRGAVWHYYDAYNAMAGETYPLCHADPAAPVNWSTEVNALHKNAEQVRAACQDPTNIASRCPAVVTGAYRKVRVLGWSKETTITITEYRCTHEADLNNCAHHLNQGSMSRLLIKSDRFFAVFVADKVTTIETWDCVLAPWP